MKKLLALVLAMLMVVSLMAACGNKTEKEEEKSKPAADVEETEKENEENQSVDSSENDPEIEESNVEVEIDDGEQEVEENNEISFDDLLAAADGE